MKVGVSDTAHINVCFVTVDYIKNVNFFISYLESNAIFLFFLFVERCQQKWANRE